MFCDHGIRIPLGMRSPGFSPALTLADSIWRLRVETNGGAVSGGSIGFRCQGLRAGREPGHRRHAHIHSNPGWAFAADTGGLGLSTVTLKNRRSAVRDTGKEILKCWSQVNRRHLEAVRGHLQHPGKRISFDRVELLTQCRIGGLWPGWLRFPGLVGSWPFG